MDTPPELPEQEANTNCGRDLDSLELEYDKIILELSQQLDSSSTPLAESSYPSPAQPQPHSVKPQLTSKQTPVSKLQAPSINPSSSSVKKKRVFAPVKNDQEVEQARAAGIPAKTLQDTKYCIGIWEVWTDYRLCENGDEILPIEELSRNDLQYWMSRFILEVKLIMQN